MKNFFGCEFKFTKKMHLNSRNTFSILVHNQIDHMFPIRKDTRIALSDKINWKKAAP